MISNAQGQQYDTTTRNPSAQNVGRKKKGGILAKPIRVYKLLTDADFRWRSSMRITVFWAITLIIIGIVFVCLSSTGVYPESVSIQKELGLYVENIVKYSLYIVAGILTLGGAHLASRKILNRRDDITTGNSTSLNLLVPQCLLVISVLIALATIGMTIQIQVEVNNSYTLAWWSWLIMALIILQRVFFACACSAAVWTLIDATHIDECRNMYNRGADI